MNKCCKPSQSGCKARCMKYAALGIVGVAAAGWVVMWLWNWLLPEIAGLKPIGFMQGVGLLVLSKILFGNFHGRCCKRGHCHKPAGEDTESLPQEGA